MKVLRSDVIGLCEALGFKTAEGWDKEKMATKLLQIATSIKEEDVELTKEQKATLSTLIACKGEVEVVTKVEGAEEAKADAPAPATEAAAGDSATELVKPKAEKKKPGRKPSGEPKPPKKPAKTKNRGQSALETVKGLTSPLTREELSKLADEQYVAAGGKTNPKESAAVTKWAVEAGVVFGVVTVDGDKVTPVAK